MSQMTGRCLCEAVTFTAEEVQTHHHACHCGMCRRWMGTAMMGVACKSVRFAGEDHIRIYESSDWAQRGFCDLCGTSLFYLFKATGQHFMSRGVFDDQTPFRLVGEIYVDHQPPDYAFAGDLSRMTEAEFLAQFEKSE